MGAERPCTEAVKAKEGALRCVVPTGTWCVRVTFAVAAAFVSACSLLPENSERLRIEEIERALLPMASVAVDTGQFETAQRLYRRLLDVSPDSYEAHMGLGDVAFKDRRSEDATQWYLGALNLAQNTADRHQALLWHGRASLEAGQLESARRSFLQLTETREQASLRDLAWAFNGVGLTRLLAGDLDGAVTAMRRAVRQAPNEPMFAENLDRALGMLAEQQRAIGPQRRARTVAQSPPVALADLPATTSAPAAAPPPPSPLPRNEPPPVVRPAAPVVRPTAPAPTAYAASAEQSAPRRSVTAPQSRPQPRPGATVQWQNEPSAAALADTPSTASAASTEPRESADFRPTTDSRPSAATPPRQVPSAPAAVPATLPTPSPVAARPTTPALVGAEPESRSRVEWQSGAPARDSARSEPASVHATPAATPLPPAQALAPGIVRREGPQVSVEIGAFETFAAADATAQRLAAVAGHAAHVVLVRSLYRVRIGPLASEAALGNVVAALAGHGYAVREAPGGVGRVAASGGPVSTGAAPPRSRGGGFIVEEGGRRFLQLGAFGTHEAARELASDLRGRTRQPVLVEEVHRGAGTLHRVRIGPLANEQTVADLRAEMSAAGYAVD